MVDKPTTNTAESKIDQAVPNTIVAAPTSPGQESKKRPLEADDSNALDEKAVKVQKLEADSGAVTAPPAPSTGENKKRSRDDGEGATNESTEAKVQKIAAGDES